MSDFKGRKDFPEVADDKIKIGDYSGVNRLSVVDIYSPKAEPELRDQMIEPVKGETNKYDSPILSQQPVIVLSDVESEEATLMKAIDGYVAKNWEKDNHAHGGVEKATPKIRHKRQMKEWEKQPIQDRGGAPTPPKPRQWTPESYEKADTVEKEGRKRADTSVHPDKPRGIMSAGSKHVGQGLHLRGQEAAKKEAGPVTTIKPGDPSHAAIMQETAGRAAQQYGQGDIPNRPLVAPLDKARVEEPKQEPADAGDRTNMGAGHQSRMREAVHSETGERFLIPPSLPQSDVATRKIRKSMELEEPSQSWTYQG